MKKPLKTFTNKEDGMESYVFENEGKDGGYNVTLKDLDADEFVPSGFVGIKDLNKAIEKAKKIVRAATSEPVRPMNNLPIIRRVAAKFAATEFKDSAKKFVEKLVQGAEKDLKAFVKSLPPKAQAWEKTTSHTESLPQRGGYGPYEVGVVFFAAGLKGTERPVEVNYTVRVVADLTNPSIGIGALSNNHVLESLASRGTMKDAPARLKKVLSFFKEGLEEGSRRLKQETKEPEAADEAWSVVTLGKDHGYATEVDVFSSKEKAEAKARDLGNCYVVKGTQMWNEPLGQVEEHNREAPYRFFR